MLTNLSKGFDCLSHDLLIAKLHAYGLDIDSLNILQDYLSNRKQRIKVDSFYSSWEAMLSGVLQGSLLGIILFNILIQDMLLILKAACFIGYADDKTPFVVRDNIADAIKALEEVGEELLNWLSNNTICPTAPVGCVLATFPVDNFAESASPVPNYGSPANISKGFFPGHKKIYPH